VDLTAKSGQNAEEINGKKQFSHNRGKKAGTFPAVISEVHYEESRVNGLVCGPASKLEKGTIGRVPPCEPSFRECKQRLD
jgi:hypothetical protein